MADPAASSDSLSFLKHARRKLRSPEMMVSSPKQHRHRRQRQQDTTKARDVVPKLGVSDSRTHLESPAGVSISAQEDSRSSERRWSTRSSFDRRVSLENNDQSPSIFGVFSAKGRLSASFSTPSTSIIRNTLKSVYLYDWWLIKVKGEGKGLGIGGFASGLNLGARIFTSAAISTRHCDTILETTDGITVRISGILNIWRTCQNGFASKVCSNFMHGFPYNWEDYAASCREKESTHVGTSSTSTSNESNKFSENFRNDSSPSLNDLPATTIHDLLRSTLGHSSYDLMVENICSDLLRTSGNECSEHSEATADLKAKNKCSVGDKTSVANATPVVQKKAKSRSRQRPSRDAVPAKQKRVTRSMSKRTRSMRVL